MAPQKISSTGLADLLKRVPSNQKKQFEVFLEKTHGYHRKVNKYPEKLPHIDWEFYRRNVRKDYVKMVEEFKIKYKELNHVFANRNEVLDFGKYYTELEKLTAEAQADVNNFIESSNSRIRIYEEEIKRLKSMVPYSNMTIEQFITEREDIAQYIPRQGKPLFWPHVPSEQRIGPAGVNYDFEKNKKQGKNDQNAPAQIAAPPPAPTKKDDKKKKKGK